MNKRTEFNVAIESLFAKIAKPLTDGTSRIGGYILPNGRQIAIQREDKREINIWTEIFDIKDLDLQSARTTYEGSDSRSSNLKSNTPSLAEPNRAYQFSFDTKKLGADSTVKQVQSLLDCYGKRSLTDIRGGNSLRSSLSPSTHSAQDLDTDLPVTPPVSPTYGQSTDIEEFDSAADESINSSSYMSDAEKRHVVERVAVDRAIAFYELEGFHVEEKGKPYDLLCSRGSLTVHVEVKGNTGSGGKVVLTINEVNDAKSPKWRSDLFIVYGIKLDQLDAKWIGSGGTTRHLQAWCPLEKDMKAIQFEYSVPQH